LSFKESGLRGYPSNLPAPLNKICSALQDLQNLLQKISCAPISLPGAVHCLLRKTDFFKAIKRPAARILRVVTGENNRPNGLGSVDVLPNEEDC